MCLVINTRYSSVKKVGICVCNCYQPKLITQVLVLLNSQVWQIGEF